MDEIRQRISDALAQLGEHPKIKSYLVVRRDGALIFSSLDEGVDAESVSSLSASMLGAFETISERLGEGGAEYALFETDTSKILAVGGEIAILVCILTSKVELSEVLALAQKCEGEIENILA